MRRIRLRIVTPEPRVVRGSTALRSWVAVLLLLVCCLPAVALSPESVADVRCFISATSLLRSPNNDVRAAAASSALYYLGKLDGRELGIDLESIIVTEARKMTSAQLRTEAEACGRELSARGAAINAIGQKLAVGPS
jgi:hypothetical protein